MMENLGGLQQHYAEECQRARRELRTQFSANTAQMIFATLHAQLGWLATPDDYHRALQTAVENGRRLAEALYPDWSEQELQSMWQARVALTN